MNRLLALISLIFFSLTAFGNNSLEKYIDTWKNIAMNQMLTHGIPASITLSQGILESGFGNSKLATEANNHFGIKCHDWKGETFLKDDDKKNECFRKYEDATQSFEDHSTFLTSRSRYASLFELEVTDYKSWAKGLKDAGYATNPNYPKRLIDIIEKYNLDQYDILATSDWIVDNNQSSTNSANEITIPSGSEVQITTNNNTTQFKQNQNTTQASVKEKHTIHVNENRTKYVIAGDHDTFYLIAKELGYSLHQLNRWNDFPANKDVLTKGDKVYIMRKRKKVKSNSVYNAIKQDKKLWEISQEYGIQLKSLLELNKENSPNMAMVEEE